ncbi:PAS domain S-box protein [Lysobacter enzymogenes]|nr:PAS domain S-box protein [Lysobacter enzymogenes]
MQRSGPSEVDPASERTRSRAARSAIRRPTARARRTGASVRARPRALDPPSAQRTQHRQHGLRRGPGGARRRRGGQGAGKPRTRAFQRGGAARAGAAALAMSASNLRAAAARTVRRRRVGRGAGVGARALRPGPARRPAAARPVPAGRARGLVRRRARRRRGGGGGAGGDRVLAGFAGADRPGRLRLVPGRRQRAGMDRSDAAAAAQSPAPAAGTVVGGAGRGRRRRRADRPRRARALSQPCRGAAARRRPDHTRGRLAGDVFDGWPQALPDRAGPLRLRGAGDKPLQAEAVPPRGPRDAFSGHAVFLREPRGAEEGMSERRLRAVFDTDLWGVCFADVQGRRWWANPGFERMLAPAADESAPMRTQSLEQLGVPAELLQRLRSEGAFEPVEVALPERGGEPSWMLLAGEALSEHDIALLALDIGERKRSDAALRAQRLLMRALIDRIPALVAYVDARQRYRLCNRAYRRWFGDRRLQGLPLRDAHPAPELAPYLPLLERAFAGQAVRFPVELSRRGAQRHFDVQFVPHRPEGDGIEGVVVHALDVTARVEAARRVEASERRFRSLAVAGAGMVWYADAAGRLLDAPGWEDLTGQARRRAARAGSARSIRSTANACARPGTSICARPSRNCSTWNSACSARTARRATWSCARCR